MCQLKTTSRREDGISEKTPLVVHLPRQAVKRQALRDFLLKSLGRLLQGTGLGFVQEAVCLPCRGDAASVSKSLNDGSVYLTTHRNDVLEEATACFAVSPSPQHHNAKSAEKGIVSIK